MSEGFLDGDTPTIEVRVFRHGELVRRELCESEEQASTVIDACSRTRRRRAGARCA